MRSLTLSDPSWTLDEITAKEVAEADPTETNDQERTHPGLAEARVGYSYGGDD
jgi:hypothetical protein